VEQPAAGPKYTHYSHLLSASSPQNSAKGLASTLAERGHTVSPVSYNRVMIRGRLAHVYKFHSTLAGQKHSYTVVRPV